MAKKTETSAAAETAEATPVTRRVLRIEAKPEAGFWRCGVKHTKAPVDHSIDRFGEEDIRRLKEEPMLVVREVDVASADPPP